MAVMYRPSDWRERGLGLAGAGLATAGLGLALWLGLLIHAGALRADDPMAVFTVAPTPPPRSPPPQSPRVPKQRPRKEGKASPPNLRARATDLVVPPTVPPVMPPPPMATATRPSTGLQASSGNAEVRGPGTGAGGIGDGTGSGGEGDGDGGGGDFTPPRLVKGRIRNADYPRAAMAANEQGTVGVKYLVGTDGRVTDCAVTTSSGSAALDQITCQLIQARFRFKPSRDGQGRPVPAYIVERHHWSIGRDEGPDDDPG